MSDCPRHVSQQGPDVINQLINSVPDSRMRACAVLRAAAVAAPARAAAVRGRAGARGAAQAGGARAGPRPPLVRVLSAAASLLGNLHLRHLPATCPAQLFVRYICLPPPGWPRHIRSNTRCAGQTNDALTCACICASPRCQGLCDYNHPLSQARALFLVAAGLRLYLRASSCEEGPDPRLIQKAFGSVWTSMRRICTLVMTAYPQVGWCSVTAGRQSSGWQVWQPVDSDRPYLGFAASIHICPRAARRDMEVREIGAALRQPQAGRAIGACMDAFPTLHLDAQLHPITRWGPA